MATDNDTLRGFAARLGIPVPEPDESGLRTLFVADDIPVFLQLAENASEAMLFAGIGTIAEADAASSCRALLQANHFWAETGGFTLALIPNTLNVLLIARQYLADDDDGASLHDLFSRFASAADVWRRRLPTIAADQAALVAAFTEAAE